MHKYVMVLLLWLVSSSALAMHAEQCGSQKDIEAILLYEGQSTIASWTGFQGNIKTRMRITSSPDGKIGFYLRGNGSDKLCVIAVLSEIISSSVSESRVRDVCSSSSQSTKAAEECLKVKQHIKDWVYQRTITVHTATSALPHSGPALVRFRICSSPALKNFQCSVTETRSN